jgi:hypothetical protein
MNLNENPDTNVSGFFLLIAIIKKAAHGQPSLLLLYTITNCYWKSAAVTPSLILTSDTASSNSIPMFITILCGNLIPFTSL